MINAQNVERNSIISFNRLKADIRTIGEWILWNRQEHEALKKRIDALEAKLGQPEHIKYVASIKAKKVHSSHCWHAKNIRQSNLTTFDLLHEAREKGYSVCDCTA